jgi:TolB-like protein
MKRTLMMALPLGVLFGISALSAQPVPAPQAAASGNSTLAPARSPSDRLVLVLPQYAPSQSASPWLGKAIQQDMVADLIQMTHSRVIAPASAPAASDEQAALEAARSAGAEFVVYGQLQTSGNNVRVTGQVLDAAHGQTLGSIKATAPADDLFPLEDSLAAQAARALAPALGLATARAPQTQPGGEYQPYVSGPQPIYSVPDYYSAPEVSPPTYYSDSPYYYPDYGYGAYPYWGGGIIIGGAFGGFHDHDHFHGGGGFHSGSHFGGFGHGPMGGGGGFHGGGSLGVHGGAIGGTHGGGGGGGGHR